MKSIITGIDHPAVAAADVEALSRWYCDMLDCKIFARTEKRIHILELPDGKYIELMPQDDTPRPQRTGFTSGWSHIALSVADMDEAMAELERRGIVWAGAEFEAAGGGRVRNFNDPEGNLLQVVCR